ncbi:MAG: hypothetical protein AB7S38_20285 [Vulcanimicrobiota bacterium]
MQIRPTPTTPPASPGFTRGAQNIKLEVAYAPEDLVKIDLIRQQEVRTVKDPDGKTREEKVAVDRSDYGISLGDGLFYDLNGNLSFVPFLAFYAPIEAAVAGLGGSFQVNPPGMFNATDVTHHGDRVNINPSWFDSTNVTIDGRRAKLDRRGSRLDVDIRQSENLTIIDPHGAFNEITVERQNNRLVVDPGGAGQAFVISRAGNHVDIDPPGALDSTRISVNSNGLTIDRPGFANGTTITVEPDRILVDPAGLANDTEIRRDGQSLTIDRPGWFNSTTVSAKG